MTAYRIQDYRMEYVYLRITEAQRQEVMALWQSTQIVPDAAERERRSHEVVILVYSPQGELAGLSSVALATLAGNTHYYVYRMFIKPGARIPYLMRAVVRRSTDRLATCKHPEGPVAGLIIVAENRKLMRPGTQRELKRLGFNKWGLSHKGEEI